MQIKVNEGEIKEDKNCEVKFDTFHFDDFVQIDVFQKNSVVNNSKIAKAFVNIRDLNCGSKTGIVPISFKPSNYGEKRAMVNGMVFLSVEFTPRPQQAFYFDWKQQIYNIHSATEQYIDRYEHMNDFLSNEFTDNCQFG